MTYMTASFTHETKIDAGVVDLFEYHRRPTVLQRLSPPWESVQILDKQGGIEDEGTTVLRVGVGPFKAEWKAGHRDYVENRQFCDVQLKGPFRSWKHVHAFRSLSEQETELNDTIHYQMPLGRLGGLLAGASIRRKLERMFVYRHTVTQNDLRHFLRYKQLSRLDVAITGGNGLIGASLAVFLTAQGHRVSILSRSGRSKVFGVPGVRWDPGRKYVDEAKLGKVDAWVHLAGENLAQGRWTKKRMKAIRDSRVEVTQFLTDFILSRNDRPGVFISASGTGFYGPGENEMSESSPKGGGFLADLCEAWEDASEGLSDAGVRRVILRTGVVLDRKGGALAKMLPIFQLGAGGRVGNGRQIWSWVAMDDLLRMYDTALLEESMSGVYNAVSPEPVSNHAFTKALGTVLRRPTVLPAPAFALKAVLGQMADEALLAGQKTIPDRLEEQGFRFDFPELSLALRHSLGLFR